MPDPQTDYQNHDAHDAATQRVAVIGIGNILMADDGIGVALVQALRHEPLPQHVELFDAGTALDAVLPHVAHCDRIILLDACTAGGEPGNVYRSTLDPDNARTTTLAGSLHDMGAVHALRLHRIAGGHIGEVIVLGVEPCEVTPREGISPPLQSRLPSIVNTVKQEVEKVCASVC